MSSTGRYYAYMDPLMDLSSMFFFLFSFLLFVCFTIKILSVFLSFARYVAVMNSIFSAQRSMVLQLLFAMQRFVQYSSSMFWNSETFQVGLPRNRDKFTSKLHFPLIILCRATLGKYTRCITWKTTGDTIQVVYLNYYIIFLS